LTRPGQKFDCRPPFLLGRFDIFDEGMQMLDQRSHNSVKAQIGPRAHPLVDGIDGIVFV